MTTANQEPSLKQRLLGALVLIALGVIFLPLILDGRKLQRFEDNLIPPEPNSPELEALTKKLIDERELLALPENSPAGTESAKLAKDTNDSDDKINRQFTSGGWVVQVGAFSERANAEKLVKRLKKAGHNAYISRFQQKHQGTVWHRVYVGPFAQREKANQAAAQLKRYPEVSPAVVVFDPLNH